jgi:hypothetical protein
MAKAANDVKRYTFGSFGKHNVALACPPKGKIGNIWAATVAIWMISTSPSIKVSLIETDHELNGSLTPQYLDELRQKWQVRMYQRITLQVNVLRDRIDVVAGMGAGNLRFELVCQCSTATFLSRFMSVEHGPLPSSIARNLPCIFVRGYKAIRSSSRETEVQVFMPACAGFSDAIQVLLLVELVRPRSRLRSTRPRKRSSEVSEDLLRHWLPKIRSLSKTTSSIQKVATTDSKSSSTIVPFVDAHDETDYAFPDPQLSTTSELLLHKEARAKRGVKGFVNGVQKSAIADTGSARNIISAAFAAKLDVQVYHQRETFKLGNTKEIQSLGMIGPL